LIGKVDKLKLKRQMNQETDEEHRLQQFMKWNSWETVYYALSRSCREQLFIWLKTVIEEWEQTK